MRLINPTPARARLRAGVLLGLVFLLTTVIYWPGLSGGWLFDDYPNIVDNREVRPTDASVSSLVAAALSSPSSEFKRPLASLSFAVNYLAGGLDPYWMKLTNLIIHLTNGFLVFLLVRRIFDSIQRFPPTTAASVGSVTFVGPHDRNGLLAMLIAAAWMVLPINLTGVLYVVQRMESMANVFVLLGLMGYVTGRQRMLADRGGSWLCTLSVILPTALGLLAKETAVMLPLYAAITEWIVFGFRRTTAKPTVDWRVLLLFILALVLPMLGGLIWITPHVLSPSAFSTRDFTLGQRLLSEARIVIDYIGWTLLPTPDALSFYHDDFQPSTSLLHPWTTLASLLALAALVGTIAWTRRRRPLVALGLSLYLGCHLLTGTILPLELIYEHRNYFASFGLLLVAVPPLSALGVNHQPLWLARRVLLCGLLVLWTALTLETSLAWRNPLRLAEELAARAPKSPRAQYELGRMYIIYSHYDRASPFTKLAYAPLERAAAMPESSILPQQALIFMNARMGLPLRQEWWDSMIAKLAARQPDVQDESSLAALTQCARLGSCSLPKALMTRAFLAALSHPTPSARLMAIYSDYAWNVLDDRQLGLRMVQEAVTASPKEPAYRITQIRMLVALGQTGQALREYRELENLNIGGSLDTELRDLRSLLGMPQSNSLHG